MNHLINLYTTSVFSFLTILLSTPAFAQVSTTEFCTANPNGDATPIFKKGLFFDGILNAAGITIPANAFLYSNGEAKCEIKNLYKLSNFNVAQSECGLTVAIEATLLREETDTSFCPPLDDKYKYCEKYYSLRANIYEKIREANQPVVDAENYRLDLLTNEYRSLLANMSTGVNNEQNIMLILLQDIKKWAKGEQTPKVGVTCGTRKRVSKPPIPIKLPKKLKFAKNAISVARTPGSEAMTSADVSPAELSLSFDRENRTNIEVDSLGNTIKSKYNDFVSFKGAVGLSISDQILPKRISNGKTTFLNDSIITSYVELDYAEKFDPTKETDNLAFGISATPQLQWNGGHFISNPTIDFRWITDIEERESAQWKASINSDIFLLSSDGFEKMGNFPIKFETQGVLDYTHVVDYGDKVALATVGENFRWGYDVNWHFNQDWISVGNFKPTLKGSYQFRDVLGRGEGNADLFSTELVLVPLDEVIGGVGWGFEYERGEKLDSLESLEAYKFKIIFKN